MAENIFAQPDPGDQTKNYNTPLSQQEEVAFQAWAKQNPQRLRDLYDYDVRGFWKAGAKVSGGHGSDEFKKPNHPTFSKFSNWVTPYTPAGDWIANPDGTWTYVQAAGNPRTPPAEDLKGYWDAAEAPRGNRLIPTVAANIFSR